MNQNQIARVCHEVNRAYCEALGDRSQVPWEEAPEWQRVSARMGVELHSMGNFGPEASHISWMAQKLYPVSPSAASGNPLAHGGATLISLTINSRHSSASSSSTTSTNSSCTCIATVYT